MQFFREVLMGMITKAGMVSLLLAVPALGQSNVAFQLALGGNNHADEIKNRNWTKFSEGDTADMQTFSPGSIITWEARLEAWGTHPGVSDPGNQYPVRGVANFVFDLELREGSEAGPIAAADFISTINDAMMSCDDFDLVSGGDFTPLAGHCGRNATTGQANSSRNTCDPCFAAAAFAFSFNTNSGTGSHQGPGRVIDTWAGQSCGAFNNPGGGPNLSVFLYPTCEPGRLYGMGAGYRAYTLAGTGQVRPLLGIDDPDNAGPNYWQFMMPGIVPVVEGQIDTAGLPEGTYVLKLIPGTGINILRGDIDLFSAQNAFALPADNTFGDTITFALQQVEPQIIQMTSIKTHGGAGDFGIDLSLDGVSEPVEPRSGGADFIEIQLDGSASLNCSDITLLSGSCVSIVDAGAGTLWELTITGASPNACQIVTVSAAKVTGPNEGVIRNIEGDANLDGNVTAGDMSLIKTNLFQPVTGGNFTSDVNHDGNITAGDMSATKTNLFASVLPCP